MNIFDYFELDENTQSIYAFAPVYVHHIQGQKVIIKRTKAEDDRLAPLKKWQEHLQANKITTLLPVAYKGKYHHKIKDDNWVIYPYIQGNTYRGSDAEIQEAGHLLGRLHAATKTPIFKHGFSWATYDQEFFQEIDDDLDKIVNKYPQDQDILNLHKAIKSMAAQACSSLKDHALPMVDASWDYKASNLIYQDKDLVLIDTDNAGYIPRIFDLALALCLFHTSLDSGPFSIFSNHQWDIFLDAYKTHITFTDLEKELWTDYLTFVYMDEALWAITSTEDNEPIGQHTFIQSLATMAIDTYKI